MKAFKRNAVIITVLLFVAVAVYLNWSYSRGEETAETGADAAQTALEQEAAATEDGESTGLYFSEEDTETAAGENDSSSYFSKVRLDRSQARDAATETLKVITETEGAAQEAIDEAVSGISEIAANTEREAEVESLVTAKGFSDCVVYISDSGVTVTVAAPEEGLTSAEVAQITEIVTEGVGCSASDIKIVEVK